MNILPPELLHTIFSHLNYEQFLLFKANLSLINSENLQFHLYDSILHDKIFIKSFPNLKISKNEVNEVNEVNETSLIYENFDTLISTCIKDHWYYSYEFIMKEYCYIVQRKHENLIKITSKNKRNSYLVYLKEIEEDESTDDETKNSKKIEFFISIYYSFDWLLLAIECNNEYVFLKLIDITIDSNKKYWNNIYDKLLLKAVEANNETVLRLLLLNILKNLAGDGYKLYIKTFLETYEINNFSNLITTFLI